MYGLRTFCLTIALVLLAGSAASARDAATVNAELPVLVTSSGQALDAFTTKTLLTRAGVENAYDPLATAADLEGIKTLVIAAGASVKGFGQAGITAESELARTRELLGAAEEQGITVIGVHIGGAERRDERSAPFVDLVSSEADALVVWREGNADGYFTRVAEQRGIPLTLIDQPMQVGEVLAEQFAQR